MPEINTFSWKRWQISYCNNATRHREHSHSTKALFKAEIKALGPTPPQSSPLKPPWGNSGAKGGPRTLQLPGLEKSLSWQWDCACWAGRVRKGQDSAGGTDKPICQGQPHFTALLFQEWFQHEVTGSSWPDTDWLFWRWSFLFPRSTIDIRHLPSQNKGDSEGGGMIWDPEVILFSF